LTEDQFKAALEGAEIVTNEDLIGREKTAVQRRQKMKPLPVMDEQEINEYLNKMLSGKQQPGNELEASVLQKFQQSTNEMTQSQNRLGNLQVEAERLRVTVQQCAGQRQAYANILIAAESQRRLNAPKEVDDGTPQGEQG